MQAHAAAGRGGGAQRLGGRRPLISRAACPLACVLAALDATQPRQCSSGIWLCWPCLPGHPGLWHHGPTRRKTKVVCTIGPTSCDRESFFRLADAGMSVVRLNMSHGSHESHKVGPSLCCACWDAAGGWHASIASPRGFCFLV